MTSTLGGAYTTVQRRHSEKWLAKITRVTAFTLENNFHGKECPVSALRFAIERLGDNFQISRDKRRGRLRCHSNCWYEFELAA